MRSPFCSSIASLLLALQLSLHSQSVVLTISFASSQYLYTFDIIIIQSYMQMVSYDHIRVNIYIIIKQNHITNSDDFIKQNNQQQNVTMSINMHNMGNRITKLKLIKDLKYGKVHLRQSLLQMSEFHDIDKIYKNKKELYSIQNQEITLRHETTEENQQEVNILISPVQRIEQYRKDRMNKKMKEKFTKQHAEKRSINSNMRVPKTTKLLKKFQDQYRNQMPLSYKEQLRQSQFNLEKIKRNDKSRFEIRQEQHKPLYQSRTFSNAHVTMTQPSEQKTNKRFMSLKTSLPEKQKYNYPSIREIMQGKLKENTTGPLIDIKSIESKLDEYLNQAIKRTRVKIDRDIEPRHSIISSPLKLKTQTINKTSERKKIKSNVERSFTRSQESSKNMIETMSSFYETKKEKKKVFDKMYKNLKYDRPLTSSIRRKNYTVYEKQILYPIDNYRSISEIERKKIRERNYQFYIKLIDGLQVFYEQMIPTTVYIVEEVKRILQTQYTITRDIFSELIENVNKLEMDHKTTEILSEIAKFVGSELKFINI